MSFKPNYHPKNRKERLSLLSELMSYINDVKNVDFDSLIQVDKEFEDMIDFKALNREVNKPMVSADGVCQSLKQELLSDIEEDFLEKLSLYVGLVEAKIEEDEFPFHEWIEHISSIELNENTTLSISYKDVLESIKDISKIDLGLATNNFVSYLKAINGKIKSPNDFFPYFEGFIKEVFPGTNINDLLCAKDTIQIYESLNKKPVPLSEGSAFFYAYAASIPNPNWVFKKLEDKNEAPKAFGSKKPQLEVTFSTSNYNEIFEEFSKTDVWKRISEKNEFKEKFVNEFFTQNLKHNPFFAYKPGPGVARSVREVLWDNIVYFVNHVSKDDISLAEKIVDKIMLKVPKDKKEENNTHAVRVINAALHEKLHKEMPVSNIKEKKNKV